MKRSVAALYALALSVTFLAAAPAQANDAAAAEVLFKKGKQLMADGQYREACEAFAESMSLDPGVGTKYQLGRCYEEQGRHASAWSAYLETASLAKASGQNERAAAARKKAEQLEPKLSKLTVQAAVDAPPNMTVKIGDTTVRKAAWGTAIPFDSGEHTVEATASGFQSWKGTVTVPANAGSVTLAVPTLQVETQTTVVDPKKTPAPVATTGGSRDDALFWGGIASVGVGVAAIGGGAAWLGIELNTDRCFQMENPLGELEEICEDPPPSAMVPPIAIMSAGGVLAGVGVLLIVLSSGSDESPASDEAASSIRVQPIVGLGYLGIAGSF